MPSSSRQIRRMGTAPFVSAHHHSTRTSLEHCCRAEYSDVHIPVVLPVVTACLLPISRLDMHIAASLAVAYQNSDRKHRLANIDRTVHDPETTLAVRHSQALQSRCHLSIDPTLVGINLRRPQAGNSCLECTPQRRCQTVRRRIFFRSAQLSHRIFDDAVRGRAVDQ